jgi:hypothetical protein
MRWTVCALAGATVLVLAAGCGTVPAGPDATPAPIGGASGAAGPPTRTPLNVNVAEALKVADREFAALKKGDWAGAWELWTDTTKKQVPRNTFLAVNRACPATLKKTYQLQEVKPVSGQLVELTYRRGDAVHHGALRTAKRGWEFEPDTTTLLEYVNGVQATIDKRKAVNDC